MAAQSRNIDANYERYYAERTADRVYPTEFVVRTFLANYPRLDYRKPGPGDSVLDIGFGDGRNTAFLCDQGLEVYGIEITQAIVDQTRERLARLGHHAELRVGRNSSIPYEDNRFDYVLACHVCYYCDEGETFDQNMAEYCRVLKSGGHLIASVADERSFIFDDSSKQPDGSYLINSDPYGNRAGYRLQAYSSTEEIAAALAPWFEGFSFGHSNADYYGINERQFWTVCRKVER